MQPNKRPPASAASKRSEVTIRRLILTPLTEENPHISHPHFFFLFLHLPSLPRFLLDKNIGLDEPHSAGYSLVRDLPNRYPADALRGEHPNIASSCHAETATDGRRSGSVGDQTPRQPHAFSQITPQKAAASRVFSSSYLKCDIVELATK